MRAFFWFLALLVLALGLGACIAYPAFKLASMVGDWAFHRVASRTAFLVLAMMLAWLARHLNIRTKADFGYGLPWRRFAAVSLLWGAIGVATGLAGAAFLLGAHIRVFEAAFVPGAASIARLFLIGLGSGIAVALIEETVMRGAIHTSIQRESGPWAAALLTAPLFAVLHFFAKVRIPPDQVGWGSGFDLIARSFAPLANPHGVLDSFAAWLVVGLVLSLTRILTGNIAVAIGLHAGWVIVLRMLQLSTEHGGPTPYDAWIGRFDWLVGLWIVPWGITIAASLWITQRIWAGYARSVN
jgi:membrane protease YdiL (CAAX protease family)